jgi:3-oxoacyl-[acyl-carrier protein] reductase
MESANRLGGQVALVTGGSRGIGAEIVRRLAAEGADVGFTYRTGQDEAQQVAAQVRALGRRVLTVQADLGEPAAAGAVVEAVVGEFGRLDILVNNAGITHWGALAQTRLEDFDRLVAVDARAPFLMMQAAADTLTDGGRVVNISSGVTSTALAGIALYSGVKAFLDQVTKVAAVEFAARGITVNAVAPGSTATGPFAQLPPRQRAEAGAAFALGRIGEASDTAGVVAFLASADAGFITGQVICNAGGQRGPIRRASLPGLPAAGGAEVRTSGTTTTGTTTGTRPGPRPGIRRRRCAGVRGRCSRPPTCSRSLTGWPRDRGRDGDFPPRRAGR